MRSLHPGPHAADVAFRTVLSFLGGPRFFETFTPLPQWTAAPFARDDFFFPRLQANVVLQCFVISCQTSNPKENVCTLPPHRSAVPVGSVRFVLFLHFFFFFYGQGRNGTRWEVIVDVSLCGSVIPKFKRQTHQAAKEIAVWFWDPMSRPNRIRPERGRHS